MSKTNEAILDLLVGICAAAAPLGNPGEALEWYVKYDKLEGGLMYFKVNEEVYTLVAADVVARFKEAKRKRENAKPAAEEGTFRYVKGGEG